jgi:hypothetical protein
VQVGLPYPRCTMRWHFCSSLDTAAEASTPCTTALCAQLLCACTPVRTAVVRACLPVPEHVFVLLCAGSPKIKCTPEGWSPIFGDCTIGKGEGQNSDMLCLKRVWESAHCILYSCLAYGLVDGQHT